MSKESGEKLEAFTFGEREALLRLEEHGVYPEWAFGIEDEKTLDGQEINAEIFWTKIGRPDDPEFSHLPGTETKMYFPNQNANGEVIIFTPGFPGGNAGRFEQRYAKAIVDAGYAFITTRHNGTSLTNGKTSAEILNSPKRMDLAAKTGEHHIGGTREEGHSPREMIDEPIPVLLALKDAFKKIHLMGQSMGVSSNYNAITELENHPEITEKIGNIVGIAGYVGGTEKEGPDGIWDGTKGSFEALADYEMTYIQKVDLNFTGGKEGYIKEMEKVAEQNAKMEVPDHVGNVLIFTPNDPLIAGPKTETGVPGVPGKMIASGETLLEYGPKSSKKVVIEDRSTPEDQKAKAHSMLWIAPENLLRAVKTEVSTHGPHYFVVGDKK